MSTATQGKAAPAAEETPAGPVLGEIIVRKINDHAKAVTWTLGTHATLTGLTVAGIAAAARASAEFLEGLGDADRKALTHGLTELRIGPVEWSMPLLPHLAGDIEALMIPVINSPGAIGRI